LDNLILDALKKFINVKVLLFQVLVVTHLVSKALRVHFLGAEFHPQELVVVVVHSLEAESHPQNLVVVPERFL
jgi:hypothetical protein